MRIAKRHHGTKRASHASIARGFPRRQGCTCVCARALWSGVGCADCCTAKLPPPRRARCRSSDSCRAKRNRRCVMILRTMGSTTSVCPALPCFGPSRAAIKPPPALAHRPARVFCAPSSVPCAAIVAQSEEKCPAKLLFSLAGGLGFEPRLTESESAVLPLNYPPITLKSQSFALGSQC